MISSVMLSGRLGKALEKGLRMVEVDRVIPGPGGHYEVDEVPVKSQSFEADAFMKEAVGSYICVKGRLEKHPKYGLIVVDELDEIFHLPAGTTRI
jgi:hypothetical protein